MNKDRELLELAAKACGIPECGWMGPVFAYVDNGTFTEWNPLTDDGDRYRLAVKLRLFSANRPTLDGWASSYMLQAELPYEQALALAIVRAAAEIGRAMP